jgi:Fungal Zn(2)-Cys(6) binuclear cluster domain
MATTTSQYPLHPESSNGSSGSPSAQQPQAAPQHKRVYQACIPCRRRKVKCDMGSVDNPHDPPCVRCRRESKECFFSATRRKRKHEDGGPDSLDGYEYDDYTVRNGRKMAHTSPPASVRQSSMGAPSSARSAAQYGDSAPVAPGPPLTPGGSIGRPQPLRRPNQPSRDNSHRIDGRNSEESNTQLENLEAQEVMRREVYGPHDALDLLYKAATDRYVPSHFVIQPCLFTY